MKKVVYQIPETLAHDFKVMCALNGLSQKSVVTQLIESFLEDNCKMDPNLKNMMEKFSKKI